MKDLEIVIPRGHAGSLIDELVTVDRISLHIPDSGASRPLDLRMEADTLRIIIAAVATGTASGIAAAIAKKIIDAVARHLASGRPVHSITYREKTISLLGCSEKELRIESKSLFPPDTSE